MSKLLIFRSKIFYAAHFCLFFIIAICSAQESKVMGEVRFEGATKVEKDLGVCVDGDYVGFLKELHGNKKVMLLPGEHEISVRQSGYDDFLSGGAWTSTHGPGGYAPQPWCCDT